MHPSPHVYQARHWTPLPLGDSFTPHNNNHSDHTAHQSHRDRDSSLSSSSTSSTSLNQNSNLDRKYKYLLFDCDGVLWHEAQLYTGADFTLETLYKAGYECYFITNNSGKSRAAFAEKLISFNLLPNRHQNNSSSDSNNNTSTSTSVSAIAIAENKPEAASLDISHIYSSSYAVAHYLFHHPQFNNAEQTVLYIGDIGIEQELSLYNIRCLSARRWSQDFKSRHELSHMRINPLIGAVVVGIDDQVNYASIALAQIHLNAIPNCLFIATNLDSTLPTDGHTLPGAGTCVAAVATASNREPINLGKPETYMYQLLSSIPSTSTTLRDDVQPNKHSIVHTRIKPEECLVIGDRLDTDIAFGNKAQIDTVLVLTGVHQEKDVLNPQNRIYPTFILTDVNQLIERH